MTLEQIWIKPVPPDVRKLIIKKRDEWKKEHGKTIGLGWATVLLIKSMQAEIEFLKNGKDVKLEEILKSKQL